MKYRFKMKVKDKETKELIEIEKRVDPEDIACYYKNGKEYYISTKSGRIYRLNHTFNEIEAVADEEYGEY